LYIFYFVIKLPTYHLRKKEERKHLLAIYDYFLLAFC